MRCDLHDLPVGQCEDTWVPRVPDYEATRARLLEDFTPRPEAPQVSATIVGAPTTDTLVRRLGYNIPTIGYPHWAVLVDDSATRDLREQREAARAEAERQELIAALNRLVDEAGFDVTYR